MIDVHVLAESLERAAGRTEVGPPPLGEMRAGARRIRRRRMVTATAMAAALVATAIGIEVLATPDEVSPPMAPAPEENTTSGPRLEGTWNVNALVSPNGLRSLIPESARGKVRLTFSGREVTGTTGCNGIFGIYRQSGEDGQDLYFPPSKLVSTLVGCDEPPLVARLLDVRHVTQQGPLVSLHDASWEIVAQLEAPRPTGDPRPGCAPHTAGSSERIPINCVTEEDMDQWNLTPSDRRATRLQQSGHPGEISVYIEGDIDENHGMLRQCRGLPVMRQGTPVPKNRLPEIEPIVCNALELMAAGKIPTNHYYSEEELRDLMRR